MQARRAEQSAASAKRGSAQIAQHVALLPEWHRATRIAVYAAVAGEVDPAPLAAQASARGATLLWPRQRSDGGLDFAASAPEALVPGPHDIPEPAAHLPATPLGPGDLVLVPGVAFDREGGRLGRGGGAYDRALAAGAVFAVGLGFEFQVVDALPIDRHDQGLQALATECGLRRFQ